MTSETTAASDEQVSIESNESPKRPAKDTLFLFSLLSRTDKRSHGYVPFFLWILLLFGGIWYPAYPFLEHVFNDNDAPQSVVFGSQQTPKQLTSNPAARSKRTEPVVVQRDGENFTYTLATTPTAPPQDEATNQNPEDTNKSKKPAPLSPWVVWIHMPFALVFWTWTNLALLCVMASAMGEVNRFEETRSDSGTEQNPDYRTACTRAFFVYLFVLLNELAVAGKLPSSAEVSGTYSRIAVLASLFCFVASYRPDFFKGLIGKFASQNEAHVSQSETPTAQTRVTSDRTEAFVMESREAVPTGASGTGDTSIVPRRKG